MRFTINVGGYAAPQVLTNIARSYAMLAIKTALPDETVGGPWLSQQYRKRGEGRARALERWRRRMTGEREAYRDALASLHLMLPTVPTIDWPITEQGAVYDPKRATEVASAWADAVVTIAKESYS